MSQLLGQSTSVDAARASEGAANSTPAAQSFHSAGDGQALFRVDLRRSLQMHRKLAVGIALLGVALAGAYFLKLWPLYIAKSLVYVQPVTPQVLNTGAAKPLAYDGSTYEAYLNEQMADATRPDVLINALHKLEPGTFQKSDESDQAAADRLAKAVDVTTNGSFQISIAARASKPDMAADLANAVTNSYLETAAVQEKEGDKQRIDILRAERDRVQTELTADRSEQEALNKQLGVSALGIGAPDLIDDDIGRTRAALDEARTAHDEAESKFAAMGAGQGPSSAAIDAQADQMIATDAGLTSMKTSLNARRAALITQMSNLTSNHPEYKQDAAELAKINSTIDSMMTDLRTKAAVQIQQGLETNLEQTAGVEDKLNGQLRQLVGAAGSAVPKMQRASDLATDITRLQARYTDVDSQLHDLLLEDGAPGSVFLETAAVPPLHAAKSSVLRNAILMMGFFMVLGLVAAVAAHKLDPRVYTGSDVEQLLGFAPMAQLPDFMEVPDQVADEQLLRLASSIEYARKQGNLKSCIFTGAASGAGVTTLATRVRDMLEAMGRPTVLVDASGIPAPPPRASLGAQAATGHTTAQLGSRSTALLQQVADEARLEESLVLTDTAPVAISAETEYLARFVDCAIVVIESGVTTREQLRAAAQALRKVDVATVGFVLNRVAMAKADPEYRNSVSAVESHLRYQSRSSGRHTVRSRHYATEEAASVATPAREAAVPRAHEPAPQPAAPRQAEPQWAPQWATPQGDAQASAVPPAPRMPQAQMAAQSVPQPESEMPWWLSDARPQRETAATAASRPAEEDTSLISESRLSGLRDVLFSLGLNNLNKSHEAELHEEAAIPIPVPVREREPERPYYGQAFVPYPESESYPEPEQETVRATPTHVIAAPEFLPPRETIGAQGKRRSWEESSVTARRDRRDTVDEVTILPSWRGQYRKKD